MPNIKSLNCHIDKLLNREKRFNDSTIQRFNPGFTLIELLIVITIIGILATIVLASFGGAQEKARDGRRKSDLAQMRRALELAKSDCKGAAFYPDLGGSGAVDAYNQMGNYIKALKYTSTTPKDPQDAGQQAYSYAVAGTQFNKCPDPSDSNPNLTVQGATDYSIWVVLERAKDADARDSRSACDGKPGPTGDSTIWTDPNYSGYYVICNN